MQQLATNLVLLLEKQALQAVQADLLNRQGRNAAETNSEHELANVKLDDLSLSLLMHMNPLPLDRRQGISSYSKTNAFYIQIMAIVAAFDAVDIDNRGVINFTDFTNFCLRVGRLLLKPSIKHTLKNYLQQNDSKGTLFPAERMRYLATPQMLFVFDADYPRARLYSKDVFVTRVNPITAARKALHMTVSSKLTYYEKMALEKQATQIRITEKELDDARGSLLDALFVDSTKQFVFTSSHSYLIFIDGAQGLYDDKGEMKVVGHLKTSFPMHTLHYSKVLDMIFAIPGEGSDHIMEVYEPRTRKLKFRVSKHDTKILSLCEVILDKSHPLKDHYFVSSSMDGKLVLWPTAPLSTMLNKLQTQRLLRMAETVDYDLKGHHHAIHSVVYASHQEIIIGAGYDFEIMAWDPFTRDMCMKFAGHFKSIAGIQIVYTPEERLLSMDESGTLKLWNVSKELGVYGTQEHSFQLHCQQPAHIKAFSRTYGEGRGIAILAEKLYFMNLENDYADDLKPLGLGVCPTAGRVFTVFKSSIHLIDMISSRQVKSLAFLDPDRVSSTDHLLSRGDELRLNSAAESNLKGLKIGVRSAGHIDIKDTVTACAVDATGKKVFIGTLDGRVLLFDSFTFGLLKQLTDEDEDDAFRHQGAVAGLSYIDRDELLVAVYAAGAVKIFGGSLRHAYAGPKYSSNRPQRRGKLGGLDRNGAQEDFIPHCGGGKPPIRPYLLRECDLGVLPDFSVRAMAFSEGHNLIAVLTKQGVVYFYDYLHLTFLGCISLELGVEHQPHTHSDAVKQFVAMRFVPLLPLLIICDSWNNVQCWAVRPMPYKFLLSWNAYDSITYDSRLCDTFENLHWHGLESTLSSPPTERFAPVPGTSLTCMRCYSFLTHCRENTTNDLGESVPGPVVVARKWILIFGNDFGQIFTQNITDLVAKSGAVDYAPRPDAFYLAYHKMKPRRYMDATAPTPSTTSSSTGVLARIRMPDDLIPKLTPIRREDTVEVILMANQEAPSKSTVKLTRQQTRKNLRNMQKGKKRLDGSLTEYVQGLEGWQVFQQAAVRELDFYDPFFQYPEDKPATRQNTHVPDLSLLPDRVPLVFTASDLGAVKLMTLSGIPLGDALDELVESTIKGAPKGSSSTSSMPAIASPSGTLSLPPQTPAASAAAQQTPSVADKVLKEATKDFTFITSVVDTQDQSPLHRFEAAEGFPAGKSPSDAAVATVYVKSEKRSTLQARKISIQPKSQAFESGSSMRGKAMLPNPSPTSARNPRSSVRSLPVSASPQYGTPHSQASEWNRKSVEGGNTLCPLVEEPTVENPLLVYVGLAPVLPTIYQLPRYPWILPTISVALPSTAVVDSKENKDVLTISTTIRMSTVQYSYYMDVLTRLVPAIETEVDARFRAQFESLRDSSDMGAGLAARRLSKQSSTYLSRFASAENLLQGLNSFLIDKKADRLKNKDHIDNTMATAITTLHQAGTKGSTRESVLEKIILTMSEREIVIAEMLKAQNQEKWARKNLSHLIDYIQGSDAFPGQVKQQQLQATATTTNPAVPSLSIGGTVFKNYDKEKARGKRAPWEVSQHHVMLDYTKLKEEYFGEKKAKKRPSTAFPREGSEVVVTKQVLGEEEATTEVLVIPPSTAAGVPPATNGEAQAPVQTSATAAPAAANKPVSVPTPLLASSAPSTPIKDFAKNWAEDTPKANRRPPIVSDNLPAPIQTAPRPATASGRRMPSPGGATSQPLLRPMSSSRQRPISHSNLADPNLPPDSAAFNTLRNLKAHTTIDGLIGQLEDITAIPSRKGRPVTAQAKAEEPTSRGRPRPRPHTAPMRSSGNADDRITDDTLLIPGASQALAFSQNRDRVQEIHGRFEDIMLTLKSSHHSYEHYDPLRQKRLLELAKHRRKLQLRAKVSQEGNNYVEDERFEGIIDMEKEAKKQENKHLLTQSRATGRKTGYGLYKYADLTKFIHLLQFLTPVVVPVYERNAMYYYDEAGTDISKYVRDQPYYLVDDVLTVTETLLGETESALLLREALTFYRDEVPRSPRIPLFNLIGVVFAMAKGWGVQLRIHMFVTCAHLLYELMASALPPRDQRMDGERTPSPSPPSSPINLPPEEYPSHSRSPSPLASSPPLRVASPTAAESSPEAPAQGRPEATPSKLRSNLHSHLQTSRQLVKQGTGTTLQSVDTIPSLPSSSGGGGVSTPQREEADGSPHEHLAEEGEEAGAVDPAEAQREEDDDLEISKLAREVQSSTLTQPAPPPVYVSEPSATQKLLRLTGNPAATSQSEGAGSDMNNVFENAMEEAVERYIVHPHPLRGFRQWIIRRKPFNAIVKILNFWCDGSMESLNVHDLIEIFHSLVPRAQLENYRIMRILPTVSHRLGLGARAELNGAALAKIFQNVLEIKIVSD